MSKKLTGRDLRAMGFDVPDGFLDRQVEYISVEAQVTHADGTVDNHGEIYRHEPDKELAEEPTTFVKRLSKRIRKILKKD